MIKHYNKLKLDCLVILGGNGTHKTANLLREEGLNVITLPKTIDNDLYGTDMTFGFQSAVDVATYAIDCIHTTAASHGRVFIVEVMGHKVGWLTLNAGIAGGADIILIPEIPYDIDKIVITSYSIHYTKLYELSGTHMVYNALAATAVGKALGLSHKEIADGIAQVKALGGRNNIIQTSKYIIIDDCYNANPVSMKAAVITSYSIHYTKLYDF